MRRTIIVRHKVTRGLVLSVLTVLCVSALAVLSVVFRPAKSNPAQDVGAPKADRLLGMVTPVKALKPYRIGYASVDMNSDFHLGLVFGALDEAKAAGVEIVRITSAGGYGKVAEQVSQLEQLGSLKLDAVIIVGAAYNGFDKVVDRLVEGGTKVVTVGVPIGAPKVSLAILQNENKIGEQLAEELCKAKPKATVITLPGPAGSEWNKMRFEGFKAAAQKCDLKLVGNTFAGNISIEDGEEQAADQLARYPDADYIFAVAGIFAVGAAQQVKRMHSSAKVVTGTLTRRTINLLKDGTIALVVSEPPIVFGRASVQYTVRLLNGDPLPNLVNGILPFPVAMVPNQALTPANIGSYDANEYDLPPEGWRPSQLQ
jgi:ABC-type sugar transport system substrate-binding protein